MGHVTFGIDVSEHQDGLSLVRAAAEGIRFAVVRTTDGTYKDRTYRSHIDDALSAGLQISAYHYLRNPSEGTTVAEQVAASVAVMGSAGVPSVPGVPVWIDCETPAGLSAGDVRAAISEFRLRGVPVAGVYTYARYWRWRMGNPDSREFGSLWLADYGPDIPGTPAELYPGDEAKVWSRPVGGQTPRMWQFGSKAQVAGFSVDINAVRA
ncbi:glycoside hydrolase family 25 protein [Corynebacterium sp. S7]